MITVRAPASSANLGPAFDALGMAVTMYAEIGVADDTGAPDEVVAPDGAHLADDRHPAVVAFRRGGGVGPLWIRSPIPPGRGLGFSGTVRVGGLVAAAAQRLGGDAGAVAAERAAVLAIATELEGHADNVAASLYGGVVATAAGRAVRVPLGVEPAVVAWVPAFTTSTNRSRRGLDRPVPFADAVFNVGRTALLVAALAAGEVDALRAATADRLHQAERFGVAAPSGAALAAGLRAGAWCGWLSGSGPTVVLLGAPAQARQLAAALPDDGVATVLAVDLGGTVLIA